VTAGASPRRLLDVSTGVDIGIGVSITCTKCGVVRDIPPAGDFERDWRALHGRPRELRVVGARNDAVAHDTMHQCPRCRETHVRVAIAVADPA
jgi:hypothetical protein